MHDADNQGLTVLGEIGHLQDDRKRQRFLGTRKNDTFTPSFFQTKESRSTKRLNQQNGMESGGGQYDNSDHGSTVEYGWPAYRFQ